MKSIFKFLGTSSEREPSVLDSLPGPLSVDSLHDNQKRALIGWVASRMGQKLHMERVQSSALIYLSFAWVNTVEHRNQDDNQYLIYLASCLIEWIQGEADVYIEAKHMALSDHYHRCLLEVYEEIKGEIPRYIQRQETIEVQRHAAEDEGWEVYRDVIFAATQRKFLLIRKDEVNGYKEGRMLCSASIADRSDIPKARDLAKQTLLEKGVPQAFMMSHLLVISEAVTNILKHAQSGTMTIMESSDGAIRVLVEDQGRGFPLKLLPNTILMEGYSTKKSLGQGFTLMLKMTDLILLSTIPDEGSTLILVFNRSIKEEGKGAAKHTNE